MQPALLFGGEVTAYAVWAVARDGAVENLGELPATEPRGEATYTTRRQAFALLVTAEPWPLVARPSDVVVFAGGAPRPSKAPSEAFGFGAFTSDAKPATPSIASLEWKGPEPAVLSQARALLARAEREKAGDPDQRTLREARAAFAEADAPGARRGASFAETARRASAFASEALREVARKRAAEEAARLEAERHAKEEARRAAAVDEAERRRQAEAALAEVEELRQRAAAEVERTRQATVALAAAEARAEEERARLAARATELRGEREALATRLGPALAKVAETVETPRGLVVTLPGDAFDAGRATLKPAGRLALARLAGILLMAPERNVRVEAHTDASGNAAANRKLSADRARNVADFLREQGIAGERVAFEGCGPEAPVAPNTTPEGRARNRRVELVVGEGTIEAPPRDGAAAPE
jgi:outer membrane protein OmpA-like peptidoglycan-associated protein